MAVVGALALAGVLAGLPAPGVVQAVPAGGPIPQSTSLVSGGTTQVFAYFDREDPGAGNAATVSVAPVSANITRLQLKSGGDSCIIDDAGDGFGVGTDTACTLPVDPDSGPGLSIFTLSEAVVGGLDGDAVSERFRIILDFSATCTQPISFLFTSSQGGVAAEGGAVTCTPPSTPTSGGGAAAVFDSCDDFTSADVREECENLPTTDNVLDCEDFESSDEATAFTDLFDSDDTNNLDGDDDGTSCEDELPSLAVQQECGPPPGSNTSEAFGCAVVVTANPNVVVCGGTSTITASVRNRAGHALAGYGYHFATDNGLLIVGPPNAAETEYATAILKLFPPGTNQVPQNPTNTATVIVSVGTTLGTIQGTVTVQQYCPTSATTAAAIALKPSTANVACNGRAFIAATVKDTLGNPVPDGTEITFLATQGSVKDEFVATSGTPTPGGSSPSVKVSTKGGVANIIYTADGGASGIVTITAASGAAFGTMDLQVCAGAAGGVRPPNTGTGVNIRPPSTGDAGLAVD